MPCCKKARTVYTSAPLLRCRGLAAEPSSGWISSGAGWVTLLADEWAGGRVGHGSDSHFCTSHHPCPGFHRCMSRWTLRNVPVATDRTAEPFQQLDDLAAGSQRVILTPHAASMRRCWQLTSRSSTSSPRLTMLPAGSAPRSLSLSNTLTLSLYLSHAHAHAHRASHPPTLLSTRAAPTTTTTATTTARQAVVVVALRL